MSFLGFPFRILDAPEITRRLEEMHEGAVERRLKACVDYSPTMKWVPELNLTAASWKVRNLFPEVVPLAEGNVNEAVKHERAFVMSPDERFVYVVKQLKRGQTLGTLYVNRRGNVLFDGDVNIPALHYRGDKNHTWTRMPWMSITPLETFTLRSGTKLARGHTVVAGLGLGYQLIEVSQKKSVTKITLVERSQELVDWLLPRIKLFLREGVELDVIVGNAYSVLPTLMADVALIGIDKTYGGNTFGEKCPGIKRKWVWGSSNTRQEEL